MAKQVKRKGKINCFGKSHSFDLSYSITTSHTNYSGYGIHEDKERKAMRRNRKLEEKRAKLGQWE